jgi:hypothetical protein
MRISLVVIAFLLASTALAQVDVTSMRCGGAIFVRGASEHQVITACGEPSWRAHSLRAVRRQVIEIDEWTYPPAPHEMGRIVTFENGALVAIRLTR